MELQYLGNTKDSIIKYVLIDNFLMIQRVLAKCHYKVQSRYLWILTKYLRQCLKMYKIIFVLILNV